MTTPNLFESRYDVVVAGARAAGAAIALLLARQGRRVLLVDRGHYGADTLSTHALMRAGVMQLSRWGVLPRIIAAGTPVVSAATFIYDGETLTVPVKSRDGIDGLYAPRRTVLDRALVDAATAAGVTTAYETALVDLQQDAYERIGGAVLRTANGDIRTVAARLVVGADGLYSPTMKLVKARTIARGCFSSAIVFGYWRDLPLHEYRWYYSPGMSAGVIPTNDGLTCVFASVPSAAFAEHFGQGVGRGYREVLARVAPDIAFRFSPYAIAGRMHGFAGMPGRLKQAAGPGWALVGDAAYFKDPLTAHGLTDAMVEAEYLAAAIADDRDESLMDYAADRDRRVRPLFDITDRIASFQWTLDEVKVLHKQLAGAMADEVESLRNRTGETTRA